MLALRRCTPSILPRTLCAFAASLCLLLPGLARADHIDDELVKNAEKMVKALQDKGYKNVGVIKFLVRRGKDELNANVGPINLNLATRVENALLLGMDPSKPLGVIRDATQISAAADPKMSVRTAAARIAMFKPTYPLAWGKDKVSADAFITGTVDLAPNMRTAKVELGYFDRKGDKIHELASFTVPTDRSILADAGQSFALSQRKLKTTRSLEELDQEAADSASEADGGKSVNTQIGAEMPIKFEILYNNTPQTISQDATSAGEFSVPTPQKGQTVTFNLVNTTQEKIGVVVKVNGESTLGQDINEDAQCQKWILQPGKNYSLRGFYSQTDNTVTIFKVLDDEESAARLAEWNGSRPRAGFIDIAVFRENPDGPEMVFGRNPNGALRGQPAGKSSRAVTAKDAVEQVKANLKQGDGKTKRGLIVQGDQKENVKLQEDNMKNATQMFNMQINYYRPTAP